MSLIRLILSLSILICTSYFSIGKCQEAPPTEYDAVKKYDELLKATPSSEIPTSTPVSTATPLPINNTNTELFKLLPNLTDVLYQNWKISEPSVSWMVGDVIPEASKIIEPYLNEIGLEEVIAQVYEKDGHKAKVFIYRFKNSTGAYSAFTVLKKGNKSKLKVGKSATEADTLINFWKGNYFVDINTLSLNDAIAKEFVVLSSQDISKNIQSDKMPPVVAIQLPSLNRIQGSEKYCIGIVCAMQFLPQILDIDYSNFNINESGGIASARYKISENPKEKKEETLILIRYVTKEIAESIFLQLKNSFEEKSKNNKDIVLDFDESDSTLKIKYKKEEYMVIKQKGNLLGISSGTSNLKSSEKTLSLIPWPIEVKSK
jgi:hypothetical protein